MGRYGGTAKTRSRSVRRLVFMEKITPENAVEISRELGREAYFTSPFILAASCYFLRKNGQLSVFFYDTVDKEIRFLYGPQLSTVGEAHGVEFARDEDIRALEVLGVSIKERKSLGPEYIYDCEKLSKSATPDLRGIRQNANYFRKNNTYRILHQYDPEKIKAFIRAWAETKDLSRYTELAKALFLLDLAMCLRYVDFVDLPQRNIFVEIDGRLVGFAFTHPLTSNMFVGLMQKVDIRYRGLSPFIYQEKAKLHPGVKYFSIGCPADTPGLLQFKD